MQSMRTRNSQKWIAGVLMTVMLVAAGCKSARTTSDDSIRIVTHEQVVALLEAEGQRTLLLDARQRGYQQEHLPGALHLPLPDVRANDPRLTGNRLLVVYGNNRKDPLSPAVAKRLIELGYTNVYDYRAGIEGWKNNGGETIRPGSDPQ